MMKLTLDNHEYVLDKPENSTLVTVSSTSQGIDMIQDTIELAGQSDEETHDFTRNPTSLAMHEGTAAMWLQFEVLNYL